MVFVASSPACQTAGSEPQEPVAAFVSVLGVALTFASALGVVSVFVVPSVFGAATEPEPSSPSSSQMDFRSGLSGNRDLSCP